MKPLRQEFNNHINYPYPDAVLNIKGGIMPWYNGDYPPSYKNQPVKIREKATEIANALLAEGVEEGIAIATGLKKAREHFKSEKVNAKKKKST